MVLFSKRREKSRGCLFKDSGPLELVKELQLWLPKETSENPGVTKLWMHKIHHEIDYTIIGLQDILEAITSP